jgi:hypothetical protein
MEDKYGALLRHIYEFWCRDGATLNYASLDEASLDDASLGLCIPWMMHPLDDASLG